MDDFAAVQRRTNALGVGGQAARDEYGYSPEPIDERAARESATGFLIELAKLENDQSSPIDVLEPILDLYGTLGQAEAQGMSSVQREKAAMATGLVRDIEQRLRDVQAVRIGTIPASAYGGDTGLDAIVDMVNSGREWGASFDAARETIAGAAPQNQIAMLLHVSSSTGISPEDLVFQWQQSGSSGGRGRLGTGFERMAQSVTASYVQERQLEQQLLGAVGEMDRIFGGLGPVGRRGESFLLAVTQNLFGEGGVNMQGLQELAGLSPRGLDEIEANPRTLTNTQRGRSVVEDLLDFNQVEPWQTEQQARAAFVNHPGYRPWAEAHGFDPDSPETFRFAVDEYNRRQTHEGRSTAVSQAFETLNGIRAYPTIRDKAWAQYIRMRHPQLYAEEEARRAGEDTSWEAGGEPSWESHPDDEARGGWAPREGERAPIEAANLDDMREQATTRQFTNEAEDGFARYTLNPETGNIDWVSKDGGQQGSIPPTMKGPYWAVLGGVFGEDIPPGMEAAVAQAHQQNVVEPAQEEAPIDYGADPDSIYDAHGLPSGGLDELPAEGVPETPQGPGVEYLQNQPEGSEAHTLPDGTPFFLREGGGGAVRRQEWFDMEGNRVRHPAQIQEMEAAVEEARAPGPVAGPPEEDAEYAGVNLGDYTPPTGREGTPQEGGGAVPYTPPEEEEEEEEEVAEEVSEEQETVGDPTEEEEAAERAEAVEPQRPEQPAGFRPQAQAELPRVQSPVGTTNFEAQAHNITPTSPSALVAANPSLSMADGAAGKMDSPRAGFSQTRQNALLESFRQGQNPPGGVA